MVVIKISHTATISPFTWTIIVLSQYIQVREDLERPLAALKQSKPQQFLCILLCDKKMASLLHVPCSTIGARLIHGGDF